MSQPYHMRLWDQWQRRSTMRRLERERREAVAAYVSQHQQSNTPEGASGRSQAVVSHEGRAVAARGSRPQSIAGTTSARATVSTTAAAPTENPGNDHQTPLSGLVAGARLHLAKQIVGQRSLL